MNSSRKILGWSMLVLAAAFGLRLVNCQRGILSDELITYWVAQLPAVRIVEERLAHNHLPTYFLLMRQWLEVVGAGELTLRLPSMVAGALAVTAVFVICARRFPLVVALLAATLLGLNATHVFVSQWARMYSVTALLEVLLFGCLLHDLRRKCWRSYAAYVAVVVVGCAFHLLFLQMAAVTAAFLAWEQRSPGVRQPSGRALGAAWVRYLTPFLVGAGLLLVWSNHAQALARNVAPAAALPWLDPQTSPVPVQTAERLPHRGGVSDPTRKILRVAFGDYYYWPALQQGWPKYGARIGLYALAGLLLWSACRGRDRLGAGTANHDRLLAERRQVLRFCLLWVVLPPLLMFLGGVIFAWVPPLSPRWLVGTAAGWAILFAVGWWNLQATSGNRLALAVLLIFVGACISWGWLRYRGDGLGEVFEYCRSRVRPGERVFLAHQGYLEQAMRFEGFLPAHAWKRSGTVVDSFGPAEGARMLREFCGDDPWLWVIHYRFPSRSALEAAYRALPEDWRWELAFEHTATAVYRLSRDSAAPSSRGAMRTP